MTEPRRARVTVGLDAEFEVEAEDATEAENAVERIVGSDQSLTGVGLTDVRLTGVQSVAWIDTGEVE